MRFNCTAALLSPETGIIDSHAYMLSLLAEFRGTGGAILFSTHSMPAAENLCDRVVMLANGRTVFEGTLAGYAKAAGERFDLKPAQEAVAALDALPWKPPTVFLMRRGANDTYTLRLASDVYPNQPNVRRYQIALDSALFDDPRFDVSTVGPFVLAIRKPTS